MLEIFNVGDEITGYCNGYFGIDDYDDKVCVFVTKDYAVFENEKGEGTVLNYEDGMDNTCREWKAY